MTQSPRTRRRLGYTLLELLLVLAILMIVAAAASPAIVGLMGDYRLKQSTEAARESLAATRIHAVDMTSTYQFRYELGGRRFLALPTDNDVLLSVPQSGMATSSTGHVSLPDCVIEQGQLGETFSFTPGIISAISTPTGSTNVPGQSVAVPSPGAASPQVGTVDVALDTAWATALGRLSTAADFSSAAWSSPIVFRPDGSASDAAFNVTDGKGHGFQLTVRELTGDISVRRAEQGSL